MLDWGVRDLADAAGVTANTVSEYENGRLMRDSNKRKLMRVFEAFGVELLGDDAPGARFHVAR